MRRVADWRRYPGAILRLVRERGLGAALQAIAARLRESWRPPAAVPVTEPAARPDAREWLAYYQAEPPGRSTTGSKHVPSSRPLVSIVILTYNNLLLSQICLASIFRNTPDSLYEVILVDNGSSDGTPAWLGGVQADHPRVKLILNGENRGFSAANNQAVALAAGDYLVFLNNDTVVPPGWLERLLHHVSADDTIGLLGPVTNATGNEARIPAAYSTPDQMERFAEDRAGAFAGQAFDIRMLAFFCVMARKHQYLELGGLDERFETGMFEDEDLALRYQARGLRVVCAEDVFIHHFWRASFEKLDQERYDRLFAENRRKFEEKWGRPWQPYRSRHDFSRS
jgi:GT2 family glycosyltransferase